MIPLNTVIKELCKAESIVAIMLGLTVVICVFVGANDLGRELGIGLIGYIGHRGVKEASEKANGEGGNKHGK